MARKKAKASVKRRKHYSVAAPKKSSKKRKRGLSDNVNLFGTGKAGKYFNPIAEGAMGGFAMQLATKAIPQSFFDENPNFAKNENLIKGGVMVALSLFAVHMKQPLIAAGIAGATAIIAMQKEGILQDDALLSNRRRSLQRGRFADDRLLSGRSQRSLRDRNIYADYDPLYERGEEYEY